MIDLINETAAASYDRDLVALAAFALRELRIHPQAELSILLVSEETMAAYHEKFMGLPGPTDVMSFPMDELRPPRDGEEPPVGLLGDIVLCPAVAERQGEENERGAKGEAEYLLIHGLLHLLGYDHAEPAEKEEMFGLNDTIIDAWNRETR